MARKRDLCSKDDGKPVGETKKDVLNEIHAVAGRGAEGALEGVEPGGRQVSQSR